MIGRRNPQRELFDVGNVFPMSLRPGTFHAQLAAVSERLFTDADFAVFYSDRLGRPSVPPSLLALVILMQHEAGVSDEEAIERTGCDLRWAAVLGCPAGTPLCARSTLALFRAHLQIHAEAGRIFLSSIQEAKRAGLLKGNALRVAVDTKPIEGRGAVEDTFNLLASGIRQLARALAGSVSQKPDDWMAAEGFGRYVEPSIKGSFDADWSDDRARNSILTEVVADARRLLALHRSSGISSQGAQLLEKLLLQDVEETTTDTGQPAATIKQGTAKGRIPSVTDPEQRHGRKSKSKSFTGAKASIAVDIDSQIIVATETLPGDAPDNLRVLDLVRQAEDNTGDAVEETIGDCAYGDGATREAFLDAERVLLAKVPKEAHRNGLFPKSAFQIDLLQNTVTCPGGVTTTTFTTTKEGAKIFQFRSACAGCALRSLCIKERDDGKIVYGGRSVRVHPQEEILRTARAYQQSSNGKAHLRTRVVVEHRLARLAQLGIGQARYMGLRRTQFQLIIAATIANLRRTWNWEAHRDSGPSRGQMQSSSQSICPAKNSCALISRIHPIIQVIERLLACVRGRNEIISRICLA